MVAHSPLESQMRAALAQCVDIALEMDTIDNLHLFALNQAECFMTPMVAGIWGDMPEESKVELTIEVVSSLLN